LIKAMGIFSLADEDVTDTLRCLLSGRYNLVSGHVTLMTRPMRGDAIAAAVVIGDQLVLVVDIDKPNALRHLRTMLREDGDLLDPECPGVDLDCIVDRWGVTRLSLGDGSSRHLVPRQRQHRPSAAGGGTGRRLW
jgi:hypothetical protein